MASIAGEHLSNPGLDDPDFFVGAGDDTPVALGAACERACHAGPHRRPLVCASEIARAASLGIYLTFKGFNASSPLFQR